MRSEGTNGDHKEDRQNPSVFFKEEWVKSMSEGLANLPARLGNGSLFIPVLLPDPSRHAQELGARRALRSHKYLRSPSATPTDVFADF